MHDMRAGLFWRKRRLKQRARILLEMDRAIMREGGVVNLQTDALRRACLIRGNIVVLIIYISIFKDSSIQMCKESQSFTAR